MHAQAESLGSDYADDNAEAAKERSESRTSHAEAAKGRIPGLAHAPRSPGHARARNTHPRPLIDAAISVTTVKMLTGERACNQRTICTHRSACAPSPRASPQRLEPLANVRPSGLGIRARGASSRAKRFHLGSVWRGWRRDRAQRRKSCQPRRDRCLCTVPSPRARIPSPGGRPAAESNLNARSRSSASDSHVGC
jgi:hypothetical protein